MPTYEYVCKSCEHAFEQFQSITAEPLRKCPACGKRALERLIGTGAGVLFKGTGFYETDYRSESYKKAAEAEKKSQTPAADSKTADAKPSSDGEKKTEKTPDKPKAKSQKKAR